MLLDLRACASCQSTRWNEIYSIFPNITTFMKSYQRSCSKKKHTSSTEVAIFKAFQKARLKIDPLNYCPRIENNNVREKLQDAQSIINFCLNEMKEKHLRDDYEELLKLIIIFLTVPVLMETLFIDFLQTFTDFLQTLFIAFLQAFHQARQVAKVISRTESTFMPRPIRLKQ